nr:reverse transcriptase domain-containing protein [Tanacetum cinerariifolium]
MRTRSRSRSRNNSPQREASPVIVEPLRIELLFLEDQFQEDPPPESPMADNRNMAELLQAPTEGYEDAIVIPEITSPAPTPSTTPAPFKAVEPNCVTFGGAYAYQNCTATHENAYRDNIQENCKLDMQGFWKERNESGRAFKVEILVCTIKCHKCGKVRHKAWYCKENSVAMGANAQPILTRYDCGASYEVELADGRVDSTNTVLKGSTLNLVNHIFEIDLMLIELGTFDVVNGMDWLVKHDAAIICGEKFVHIPY